VPLTISVARSLSAGDVGVDAIALLAMAGALVLGGLLAGAVVPVMLRGGNALEATAATPTGGSAARPRAHGRARSRHRRLMECHEEGLAQAD
jgi:hypothetical protein